MTLIKTSLLNAIAVIIKILTMLGINKILALYVGPAGYAALGQFQNAAQMITTFSSGAINTGVTKYTAEFYEDEVQQRKVWQTAGSIAAVGSILTGLLVAIFSNYLALWFLKDEKFKLVFVFFGLTLIFFVFNALLLAILNGKKEIPRFIFINIIGSIFFLCLSAWMIVYYGLFGALLALAINQSLVFFITILFCYNTTWFKFKYILGAVDKQVAKKLSKFTAMALTTAIMTPLSQILVRNHLGLKFGWDFAGCWEAMSRLSGVYLMFVTTTLGIYYLPKLSELKEPSAIKNEIVQGYKIILPITACCALAIYFLRDFIISLLFSDEFAPMRDLFAWQMLGDTIKISSWLLGYILIAKAFFKAVIFSEIFFSFSFYAITYATSQIFGLKSVSIAYVINYALYFLFMYIFLNKMRVI